MGMEMEGIDIPVLFPTVGLSFLARDDMDPQFSSFALVPDSEAAPVKGACQSLAEGVHRGRRPNSLERGNAGELAPTRLERWLQVLGAARGSRVVFVPWP
jgi:hypothetical protein